MKTQRSFVALLCLVMASIFTANGKPLHEPEKMIVRLENIGPDAIGLQMANLLQLRTKVCITDLDGRPWFKEYVQKENGYAKKLNLAGMPSGEYLLSVQNEQECFVRAFAKRETGIVFFQAPSVEVKSPVITHFSTPGPQTIGVQLANLQGKNTSVQLNTIDGVVVVNDSVNGQTGYAKKFNLTGLESGAYCYVVRTGGLVQVQIFRFRPEGLVLDELQLLELADRSSELAVK